MAKLLSRNDQDIVLIDEDEERLAGISSDYDLMTVHASPSSIQALKNAGTGNADLYIGVTPDENMNMNSCILAKGLGAKRTVAKVNNYEFLNPELKDFFAKIGIDSLIYPENLAAQDIVNGLKMSWVRQRWDVHNGALVMLGIKLRETCEILNEPLKELCKPESPYHIVAVKRGEDTIIPRGDDVLKMYDMAYFMTTRNYIPYIRKIVGKEHYVDVKNVMVMGGGNTAIRAVKMIPEYMGAKIIEADEHRCEQINEEIDTDRVMVINGDGRDIPLLIEEGVKNTQAFVALTGNAETNILACLTAKRLGVRPAGLHLRPGGSHDRPAHSDCGSRRNPDRDRRVFGDGGRVDAGVERGGFDVAMDRLCVHSPYVDIDYQRICERMVRSRRRIAPKCKAKCCLGTI